MENVSVVQSGPTREQVSVIARDPELRKLRPNTPEYQAAFEKKFPINGTQSSASAAESKDEPVKTNNEVSGQTEASDDGVDAEDKALSVKAQKRIALLTRERNQERGLATQLQARIAELENAGKTPRQAEKQATAETQQTTEFTKAKPKLSDFKNIEEYNEAYFDWKSDKKDFEVEQKSKAKTTQESVASVMNKFWDEGSKLEKELGLGEGDFKALVSDLGFKTPNSTIQAIVESPFSAKIAIELANLDDTEKERIGKMSPIQQIAFVGKLEAKFESKKQQATETTVSAAKAPGRPLKKGTGVSSTAITPKMGFKAYEAARKAQRPDMFRR
jgi:hypothetical protein